MFGWGKQSKWIFSGSIVLACLIASSLVQCSTKLDRYLSLDPDNQYTGIESCQSCHQRIYQSYIETGMGKSMYRPDRNQIIERFGENEVVYDPQKDFHYLALWKGDQMFIQEFRLASRDTVYFREEKVDYVVGSGNQTRSYLLERQGYLYEHPITWYVERQIWDLSPGYEVKNSRFSREIGVECLACHTGKIDYVEGSKNRYHELSLGIDCEKCHGPGEAHIRLIQQGQLIDVGEEIDYSIVNPAKLPIDQQFDVCQQCHLQGVNVELENRALAYRPAMRLNESRQVFIQEDADVDAFGIASHAERLRASNCFVGSKGELSCTTCHNPHKSIHITDQSVYIRQCQHCHHDNKEKLCSASAVEQQSMQGDCISCHMPKGGTSDIPHVSFHDHKIRIVSHQDSISVAEIADYIHLRAATDSIVSPSLQGKAWLLFYERQQAKPIYLDKADSLLSGEISYETARIAFYRANYSQALDHIQLVLANSPEDVFARFLQGEILEAMNRFEAAYAAFDQLFQAQPDNIEAGLRAGVNLLRARQGDREALEVGRTIFDNLLQTKPFDHRILTNLGFVAMNQRRFMEAERYLVRALSYEPDDRQALENMVLLQVVTANRLLARRYLDQLSDKHANYARLDGLRKMVEEASP